MKTNEIALETGISKQTLMFYEKEGLINPKRDSNGYRNYDDQDLLTLQLVKFLRSMDIALDDIKLILNGELLLSDCLKIKQESIENSINELVDMKHTIDFIKEKELPLIPALKDFDFEKEPIFMPFLKANNRVTIGRRVDKKIFKKKLIYAIYILIIVEMCCFMGYYKTLHTMPPIWFYLVIVVVFGLVVLVDLYNALDDFTFIEFVEKGVYYTPFVSMKFKDKLKYIKDIATHDQSELNQFSTYENISKVEITHRRVYMRTLDRLGMAYPVVIAKFTFSFYNGDLFEISSLNISKQDKVLIGHILKEKVQNIVDLDGIIEGYINKQDISELLLNKTK